MKKKLENSLAFVRGRIKSLEATANTLTGDDKTAVENSIAGLKETEEAIKNAIAMCDNAADLAAVRTQVEEVQNAVKAIRETMKTAKSVKNTLAELAKTKEFRAAFVETVKNTMKPQEFKAAWREKVNELMTKNGIDPGNITAGDFLPGFILNEINDRFVGKRHRILELVDWTGLPLWKSLFENREDMGHVHERGTEKTEQQLEFDKIEIRPDYVYKYIKVDQILIRETRDMDDVLYRYIIAELLDRLLQTIENLIVTGSHPFLPATEKVSGVDANGNAIFEAGYYMDDSEGAIAIMSKTMYYNIKSNLNSMTVNGGRLVTHDDVLAFFGVEEIVFNNSMFVPTTPNATWQGILFMSPRDYKMVGDRRPDQYEDFNLAYNQREYLMEMFVGGGCTKPDQFVAIITV